MPKAQINFRASELTSGQISRLEEWFETGQTDVIARAIEELYNRELDRRQKNLIEEICRFARQFSDKEGELSEEETGYAKAMLLVARTLPVEFDDVTDALLDHIEFNKL
jgi:hypothetical protein